MNFSNAIESQLADIAKKSKLLLEMQRELESIHDEGKGQLTSLQEEKTQLLSEQEHLQAQLTAISERLVVVDIAIKNAEEEKMFKLQEWSRRSTNHGLINGVPLAN